MTSGSKKVGIQGWWQRRLRAVGCFGLFVATTASCGFNDAMILRTTATDGVGGTNGYGGGSNIQHEPRPSPFCTLKWGRSWGGTNAEVQASGMPSYPDNLGMMSIWFGYETDDLLNPAITEMLSTLGPSGDPLLRGVIPVFYAYLIPFKAQVWDDISKDCNPSGPNSNVCIDGASWIRSNRDRLRSTYASYADQVAAVWGTTSPLVWLFEPGFNDYLRSSQTAPLSLAELSAVATDLISTIKLRLPNAIVSHYASPELDDLEGYFGAMDLRYVDLVNVTGTARLDYYGGGNNAVNRAATYARLHAATRRSIYVDTGFSASTVGAIDWLSAGAATVNQRIADGVVAVHIDQAPSSMQGSIATLSTQLSALPCQP